MEPETFIKSLQTFPDTLATLLVHVTPEDAVWRPPDDAWSVLEIVAHLAEEEQRDFKVRLRLTLQSPDKDWPGIDPERWAIENNYNAGDLGQSLQRFHQERKQSLQWLRSMVDPDWNATHTHPKLGTITAGDLLAAWTAHDFFHLRQLTKRLLQLLARDAAPHSIDYAGGNI